MLVTPEEEYHEIGIRMGMDFYTLLGYEVVYIGCSTPRDTLLNAAKTLRPDLVSISVTNYLNLDWSIPRSAATPRSRSAP